MKLNLIYLGVSIALILFTLALLMRDYARWFIWIAFFVIIVTAWGGSWQMASHFYRVLRHREPLRLEPPSRRLHVVALAAFGVAVIVFVVLWGIRA